MQLALPSYHECQRPLISLVFRDNGKLFSLGKPTVYLLFYNKKKQKKIHRAVITNKTVQPSYPEQQESIAS